MLLEEMMKRERREGHEEGVFLTRQNDIISFLEEYGEISTELLERIHAEHDATVLKKWLRLAAKVNSIEEFQHAI